MIRWALSCFGIAVIAGILAFTGIAIVLAPVAEFIFFLALGLFAVFLVVGLAIGKNH